MRIYLAGAENSSNFDVLAKAKPHNLFFSFWSFVKSSGHKVTVNSSQADKAFEMSRSIGASVIVDSGAHSFFSSDPNKAFSAAPNRSMSDAPDPEVYFDQYLGWLKDYASGMDYFVEHDIGSIVGQPRVKQWRKRLESVGLADKCMIVFHPKVESWAKFWDVAKRFPSKYIGLEGVVANRAPMPYNDAVKPCYEHGIKVHGFAMVKTKWLKQTPFYSVDSTSWLGYNMFNNLAVLDRRNLRFNQVYLCKAYSKKHVRNLSRLFVEHGQVWYVDQRDTKTAKTIKGKTKDVTFGALCYSVSQYTELARLFTDYWVRRGVDWERRLAKAKN